MPGVLPLSPFPIMADPDQQSVHSNATVTTSGSQILTGYGGSEITLAINVRAAPTGTAPTIQYSLQEVDPGDGTTLIGTAVTSTPINTVNNQRITLELTSGGSFKVTWTVTGTTPSFTQVYATLVSKIVARIINQGNGNGTPGQFWYVRITDGGNGSFLTGTSTAANTSPAIITAQSPSTPPSPGVQFITLNGTIAANGNSVLRYYGEEEVSLFINIRNAPTGTLPTITYTLQEVDPGDLATPIGNSVTGATLNGVSTQILTLPITTSPVVKVSWVVGGTSPSFSGLYVTIAGKANGASIIYDRNNNGPAAVKPASTAPLATDPALVVAVTPNQQTIPVTLKAASGATTGVQVGILLSGASNTAARLRATTYNEQSANFTGSVVSSSANDTSAGTGARTIKITYYDQTGVGPLTESAALNGTTAVNLSNANHCFIEKVEVITVGSNTSNVGTITLFTGSGGTGTAVCVIGTGSVNSGGDMRTFLGHHYTPLGKSSSLATLTVGTTGNQTGSLYITSTSPLVAGSSELIVSDIVIAAQTSSSIVRTFGNPTVVAGFARIQAWVVPVGANTKWFASFDFSDQ